MPLTRSTAGWAKALVRALETKGVDSSSILAEANFPVEALTSPDFFLEARLVNHLWRQCIDVVGDPEFAVRVSEHVYPSSLGVLGVICSVSGNIREALKCYELYSGTVTDTLAINLDWGDQTTMLSVTYPDSAKCTPCDHSIDALFGTVIKFPQRFMGCSLDIKQVCMRRATPENPEFYEDYFGARIEFNAKTDCIEVLNSCLDRPAPNANYSLKKMLEPQLFTVRASLEGKSTISKVIVHIHRHLDKGSVSQALVAAKLNISVSAMQKRLQEEGESFTGLVQRARKDLAISYLVNSPFSIKQIAHKLGFSSAGNFTRAFKLWFGVAPTAYRIQHREHHRR